MKLYWIKTSEMNDPISEGYIGVTTRDVMLRFDEHKTNSDNPHLKRAFNKYDLIVEQLFEGDEKEILLLENILRPNKNIGWNIAPGGGLPPHYSLWLTEGHREAARKKMLGNRHKLGKKENIETKELKKKVYHENYDDRSYAQKNKSIEWKQKAALNRKGKGIGERNSMASDEAREKVAASKRGRKRIYREDGSFYLSKAV